MLQLPQTTSSRVPLRAPRRRAAKPPRKSAVAAAIAEYHAARRAEGIAKRRLDRILALHPDIAHRLPLVLIHTRKSDGKKIYGRTRDDLERVFPPSLDGTFSYYVEKRKQFFDARKTAQVELDKRRDEAGITALENAYFRATGRTSRAFNIIVKLRPTSTRDLGTLSRFFLKALPVYCEGKIWNVYKANDLDGYRAMEERRSSALSQVEVVLRTWSKL